MPRKTKGQQTTPLLNSFQIEAMFDIFAQEIIPRSELQWTHPIDLVVAVVLSAQSTDKQVNKVTEPLFRRCRSTEDYLALGEGGLQVFIRSLGLYRNKAKAIIGLCRMLKENCDNRIPDQREGLQSLPGVGRKSANVILNVLFGQETLAVDTHIFRVANRIGLTQTKTPEATERALLECIPKKYLQHAHHYLVLHGRYTCKARHPRCQDCHISDYCNYPDKTDH